jgi:hypothetical protein
VSDTLPEQRSPDDVVADKDTLNKELTMVAGRHSGDLSHATTVRAVVVYKGSRLMQAADPTVERRIRTMAGSGRGEVGRAIDGGKS